MKTNLPLSLTSFIGRDHEIYEVKRLLGTMRLLTLTGAGGCGKTRLALRVAGDLGDAFPDGVWFIDLAPLADPALTLKSSRPCSLWLRFLRQSMFNSKILSVPRIFCSSWITASI